MLALKFFELLFEDKYTKLWQVIFAANLSLLLYLTLTTSTHNQISIENIDKLYHFIAFGAVAFSWRLAFKQVNVIWIVTLVILLGTGVEVAQSHIPGRDFSYADMIADALGAITAVMFLKGLEIKNMERGQPNDY